MPTIGDDERQYWNPGGLFAERTAAYFRRPGRSPWRAWLALFLLAAIATGLLFALILPLL
jgi:hypothetical protein